MSLNYYLRKNTLLQGKKFFAKTIYSRTLDDEKILAYMVKKNTAMSITELRGVLNLLKQSFTELLSEGCRLVLNDLVSLYPAVKASFDRNNEAFNHNTVKVKVRCRVAESLSHVVSKKAIVEKVGKPDEIPTLKNVISGKQKVNAIRWPYSTTVIGEGLNPDDREITGLRVLNQNNTDENFRITQEHLVLDGQSKKEVSFSITHDCPIPEWLSEELPVYLQLEYPGEDPNMPLVSKSVRTFWLKKPETSEALETEENVSTEETSI